MLKLTTDKHEASRGLSATAELLVSITTVGRYVSNCFYGRIRRKKCYIMLIAKFLVKISYSQVWQRTNGRMDKRTDR